MTKVPEYPRPHEDTVHFAIGVESAIANEATIIPILNYDEGLGVINTYKSNPQNAGFLEYAGPNCYPTSTINSIFCEMEVSLSKEALETDKVHALKFATMKIHTAFLDGSQAEDEVSGLDLFEILELQSETTDRQVFPLYNNVSMKTYKTGALNLGADQDGLTTDLKIEGITFLPDDYYDCLHYYTNGHKLASMQSGLQWHTLTRQHPVKRLRFSQESGTKYMNPYAFLGVMIYVPQNDMQTVSQYGKTGDTTDVGHFEVSFKYRFNEWNHEFNHALQ